MKKSKQKSSRVLNEPLWYKNAIIYETHVKAFYDSNNDGIGDFPGLTQKLDYIKDLGINTLWLLPFYPSPFKDDGYDISDYMGVHPSYGTLSDFKVFLKKAHKLGIKVITELVINHTSDAHPWFQAARKAPPNSSKRNYYVWNETDEKYKDARIIFTDTETSNWTWDPVAKAYYWHRFFSHQPDLNFDNPQVVKKLLTVMRFWLDMGVDGLRLDAIPYLCEREGTSCENLPETHDIIKHFRSELDKKYPDRVFLAEANQWPEDAAEYFGDGDECQMAYHFPVMPRMYMAVALEDRHPIVEIMQQTPDIPENCQWAIFLRNHDELTLEMVTNKERDYMYKAYASDPRARINVGIRRRLTPLMEYNRAKIELMNALLFSLPGSPIIYYGDEIGMGDNIFLGDRNGVRTPMQWTPDRNGGFSKADPEKLYLPAIMEAITGYQAVNVEAQSKNSSSLLNWMKKVIKVRKNFKAFGEGSIRFVNPANRTVLAFIRSHENSNILCVANLSRSAQPVHLQLEEFAGYTPVELLGKHPFPVISNEPYQLSLAGFGFYWFELSKTVSGPAWQNLYGIQSEEHPVIVVRAKGSGQKSACISSFIDSSKFLTSLSNALCSHFSNQRWFAAKDKKIKKMTVKEKKTVAMNDGFEWALSFIQATSSNESSQLYFFPFNLSWEDSGVSQSDFSGSLFAKVRLQNQIGFLADAIGSDEFCYSVLKAIEKGEKIALSDGMLRFVSTDLKSSENDCSELTIRRPHVEQSHSSIFIGEKYIFKFYRRIQPGKNPELQMGKYLAEKCGFKNIAKVAGSFEYTDDNNESYTLGILQEYVDNQGDMWEFTRNYLLRNIETLKFVDLDNEDLDHPESEELHVLYHSLMRTLGKRIGQMHMCLSSDTSDMSFKPEQASADDWGQWISSLSDSWQRVVQTIKDREETFSSILKPALSKLLNNSEKIRTGIKNIAVADKSFVKIRHHGDLHLGQVLLVKDDFVIIDFEGEPSKPISTRCTKQCALRDVAGILRSLDYASSSVYRQLLKEHPESATKTLSYLEHWLDNSAKTFLEGYNETAKDGNFIPASPETLEKMIGFFCLEKALYEFEYELKNRPSWLEIPLHGIISSLEKMKLF